MEYLFFQYSLHCHIQNGYAVPDITNNDQVFYGDIKRALMDTSYYLTAVETDWPTQNKKYFKKR